MDALIAKSFRFADFELDGPRRLLRKQGEPVALHSKTFDLLTALLERHGEVVGKDELLERVWPGQFVEEGNLTVQISALRKLLGERKDEHEFIVTVTGRGYSFVAEIDEATNGEVIVESHNFSRMIIEETVDDYATTPAPRSRTLSNTIVSNRTLVAAFLLTAITGLATTAYLYRRSGVENVAVPFEKSVIKRLTNTGNISTAALSPDGKFFTYVTNDAGIKALWSGSVEGGKDVMLLAPSEISFVDLAFTPDSQNVYYTANSAVSPTYSLYSIPVLGGPPRKILDRVGRFSLAPDGKRFAFTENIDAQKTNRLCITDLENGAITEVASFPVMSSIVMDSQSWSPDGSKLAFGLVTDDPQPQQDIFTLDVSTNSIARVTRFGWGSVVKTAWLKDGSGLLIAAEEKGSRPSVSHSQLWYISYPGGDVHKLTNDLSSYRSSVDVGGDAVLSVELRQMNNIWVAPADDLSKLKQLTFSSFGKYDGLWGMDWTADGRIVYTTTDAESQVVALMNGDGSGVTQLTTSGFNDKMLNASNDGRYIVFESSRGGGSDIWRMDSDGGNIVQLTTGGRNYCPFVSPDSKTIYYKSFMTELGELRRMSIDGGESEALTDIEVWWLSVSPDGKYVAAGVHTDKTRLTIYDFNGGPPLKHFDLARYGSMSINSRWTPDGKAVAYRDMRYGYWVQPVDGGEPHRMEGLPKEKFYNFAWSKDGKQFAFVRGEEVREVVLLRQVESRGEGGR